MRNNPHNRILKGEPKEQHLSTVLKSYFFKIILEVNQTLNQDKSIA